MAVYGLDSRSDHADVLRFVALAPRSDLELHGLALGERRGTTGKQVRDMHEHVLTPVPGDETKPSSLVEELHFAFYNHQLASLRSNDQIDHLAGYGSLN
jgi:hypothetical protein